MDVVRVSRAVTDALRAASISGGSTTPVLSITSELPSMPQLIP